LVKRVTVQWFHLVSFSYLVLVAATLRSDVFPVMRRGASPALRAISQLCTSPADAPEARCHRPVPQPDVAKFTVAYRYKLAQAGRSQASSLEPTVQAASRYAYFVASESHCGRVEQHDRQKASGYIARHCHLHSGRIAQKSIARLATVKPASHRVK
jgi:hypothetical protein